MHFQNVLIARREMVCRRPRTRPTPCFEVIPAPGFTFFSDASGQRIADAVVDLLTVPQVRGVAC